MKEKEVVDVDGVTLHQGDDHEAASERERTYFECRPGQRAQPAGGCRRGGKRQGRRSVHPQGPVALPPPHGDLDPAACE
jgi:hypothetical protein